MEASLIVFTLSACFKILLFPAYRSTDFEVHRNWLAITHSLPISKWYYEATSEWTLDYPPFFAWFEAVLSLFAGLVDPGIVDINNQYFSDYTVVWFQRGTVIATELVLYYAITEYCRVREGFTRGQGNLVKFILCFQLLANFGLIIIDHIHFQYNGFLFGLLLLSITRIIEGRHLEGAIWFSVLLNMKHIFLYISPAYFVYLLKHYCFTTSEDQHKKVETPSLRQFRVDRFLLLGALVVTVCILSFGPFIAMGQLGQVVSRLFPFKRGLCHAYWAPNFWTLYNVADKGLAIIVTRLGYTLSVVNGSMTSGLVGEMSHQILPSVPPIVTLILTVITMTPPLLKLWFSRSTCEDFIKLVVICAYSSFLFGWHVHEKAVLMITIPMSLLALEDVKFTRIYLLLSAVGHVSLFPLLFTSAETLIKLCLYALFTISSFFTIPLLLVNKSDGKNSKKNLKSPRSWFPTYPSLTSFDSLLLTIVLLVQLFCLCASPLFHSLPFLPLLITSFSCSLAINWTWLLTLKCYFIT